MQSHRTKADELYPRPCLRGLAESHACLGQTIAAGILTEGTETILQLQRAIFQPLVCRNDLLLGRPSNRSRVICVLQGECRCARKQQDAGGDSSDHRPSRNAISAARSSRDSSAARCLAPAASSPNCPSKTVRSEEHTSELQSQ